MGKRTRVRQGAPNGAGPEADELESTEAREFPAPPPSAAPQRLEAEEVRLLRELSGRVDALSGLAERLTLDARAAAWGADAARRELARETRAILVRHGCDPDEREWQLDELHQIVPGRRLERAAGPAAAVTADNQTGE